VLSETTLAAGHGHVQTGRVPRSEPSFDELLQLLEGVRHEDSTVDGAVPTVQPIRPRPAPAIETATDPVSW
jgi:hypothetical protein